MDEIVKVVFSVVVFPGLIFSCAVGLFLCWVDRKVTARIQNRIGPPWYQCYTDILKLMCKTMIIPRGSRKAGFLFAPLLGLSGMVLVATFILSVIIQPGTGFTGDLIVILYLLILPSLALIIGGSSSKNPFGTVGSSREMKMMLAYELPFIIVILTVIVKTKSILLTDIIHYQVSQGVLLANPSGLIALIVGFICIHAKLGYIPFDIPEAESELMGGVLAEYSGTALAIFKLINAMMLFILPLFLMILFLGGVRFSIPGIAIALAEFFIILFLIIILKSTHPRLRIDQAIRFFWWRLTPVALVGLILALIGV
ncbi:respiratory chain complex I subunit 1 family protein [bacterium]